MWEKKDWSHYSIGPYDPISDKNDIAKILWNYAKAFKHPNYKVPPTSIKLCPE
jgi:hypothetical protein